MKRIASIQDISCLGRCSLTVALPVISALGVECAIVPTAVLSAHTAFPGFVSRDLTDQLDAIAAHWQAQHVHFDALYTGYIASVPQVQQVLDFFDAVKSPDTMIFVDPAMADHGKLYSGFGPDFPAAMARVVARADVAMPNLTEACLLTGTPYREDMDIRSSSVSVLSNTSGVDTTPTPHRSLLTAPTLCATVSPSDRDIASPGISWSFSQTRSGPVYPSS